MEQNSGSVKTNCSQLKQVLQSIRKSIEEGSVTKQNVLQPFQYLISLRGQFRDVAKEIEAKKVLAKIKKEKLEKAKSHLDGLEYCKAMLKTEIEICKVEVVDVEEVIQQKIEFQWIEGFDSIKKLLLDWISQSKSKKEVLRQARTSIRQSQSKIEAKRNLFKNQLPIQLKKISQLLMGLAGIFGVESVHLLNPIKEPKLVGLYSYFQPLKQSKEIQMEYSEQVISVRIQLKPNHSAFEFFNQVGCPVEQKIIEIQFSTILNNILVASIGRNLGISNEQIFSRLVDDEPTVKLFENPKNEQQRNSNHRFVRLKWLDSISNSKSNLSISCLELVKRIQTRLTSLILIKYLFANLAINKFSFFFKVISQNQKASTLDLKNQDFNQHKFAIQTFSKITYEQFTKLLFVPEWVTKDVGQIPKTQNGHLIVSKYEYQYNAQLKDIDNNKNRYYKVLLHYHEKRITFVIILPFNYPTQPSIIKIITIEKRNPSPKQPLPDRKISSLKPSLVGTSVANEIRSKMVESEVNQGMTVLGKRKEQFYIFYQINRLFAILEHSAIVESNEGLLVSKLFDY